MPAHDANNATWYVLRYAEDFVAPPDASGPTTPFDEPSIPFLSPTLFFDERRGVLELQIDASPEAAEPPPGIAIDVNGDAWRVDEHGVLVVVRCDGSTATRPCQPGILAQPAGLAIDRRGLLYVADPAARRVVVFDPEDGSVRAVLGGGGAAGTLAAPVDVAVSPSGLIWIVDRLAGRLVAFSAAMKPLVSRPLDSAPGKPSTPIAVMVDAEGNVLVADAWLPRLLRYTQGGDRLGDVALSTLVAPLAGGDLALGALRRAYAGRVPRFLVGSCGPCAVPVDTGGRRLSEVHAALRVLALTLGHRFAPSGFWVSRALDGGRPGLAWHRIAVEFNGDPPPGSSVLIETFTSDSATPGEPVWDAARRPSGEAISFTTHPSQIVQSARGRFLWMRVTLVASADGGTPSISAIRVWYPRVSWLDLLPSAYRRSPEAAVFMDRFLALFEHVFTRIENRYERFSRDLNPDVAPREVIDWLAALIDLAFDPSWPLERRRALVGEAMSLYRMRGTVAGIARYVEVYTGIRPEIVEGWLERPSRPAFLGRSGSVLGCGLPIIGGCGSPGIVPDDQLWARYAHRFTIFVYLDDPCDADVMLRAVDRIVEVNKPAHTSHRLETILPHARVGLQSRVGLDYVLGGDPAPAGVLGVDAIIGARRQAYVRRLEGMRIE